MATSADPPRARSASRRRALLPFLCLIALAQASAQTSLAAEAGPDLVLDVERMRSSAKISTGIYHRPMKKAPALDATVPISGTCVLDPDENCVGGPGIRKLLRFDVLVHNRGTEDLIVGDPAERSDLFVYSACHRHYHFRKAALYELLDASGQVVKVGRKQGFCIEDTLPSDGRGAPPKRYDCKNQGIQVGWADFYPSILDCQWIDITDLPPGDYKLHVFWNPERLMNETSIANNEGTVPVTIPVPADAAPVIDEIRSPKGSERIRVGDALEISWRAHDDREIVTQEIWLSTDDGATFSQIVGDLPGDRRRFSLRVPSLAGGAEARVKVVARDASVQRGELVSESFRITPRQSRLPSVAR